MHYYTTNFIYIRADKGVKFTLIHNKLNTKDKSAVIKQLNVVREVICKEFETSLCLYAHEMLKNSHKSCENLR